MRLQTGTAPPAVVQQGRLLAGVVAIGALSLLSAGALSLGGGWTKFTLAIAVIFCAGAALAWRRPALLRRGLLVVELPVLLLILDVYYSNARSASDLSSNPLNSGGMVKLAAVCLAGLIGGITYATLPVAERRMPPAFRLFALYSAAVFLSLPASVDPLLTTYRGIELAAGVLVVAGAYRAHGQDAVVRIERLLYAIVAGLVLSVWVGVVVAPHSALVPLPRSPVHWQIVGVQPPIASNGVGTLGVVLALWSLARLASATAQDRMRRSYAIAFFGLGLVTSVAAQYRTGYVELAAGLALLLLLKGRKALALVMATVLTAGAVWGFSGALTSAQPFLLRGDTTQQAEQLSGRTQLWSAAMPFWRKSPLFGRGLLTSTRLEVLPSIGYTDTANVHSTWVETLVGTGLVGTMLLGTALLLLFGRAVLVALRPGGRVVPAVLLLALLVRSITGDSVESLGIGALLLLAFALDRGPPLPPLRPRGRIS